MPKTKPTTAPAARPAARSSPTAHCRACSNRAGRARSTSWADWDSAWAMRARMHRSIEEAAMRWQDFRRSDNVEESSDSGSSGIGGIHLGVGGILAVVVVSLLLGKNPLDFLALLSDSGAPTQTTAVRRRSLRARPGAARRATSRRNSWRAFWATPKTSGASVFQQKADATNRQSLCSSGARPDSACGLASAATGPFYCPGDRESLSRSRVFPGAVDALRRTRRLRPRVCDRARSRPPCPESARA